MGKTIRRVIALLLAATAIILLVLPADNVSATYTKGDYVIDGGTLVSYTGTESDITIPIGISAIGKEAFSGNNNLVSVYIPDEITSIDYAAFENCKNLKKVDIGNGVKAIGSSAFSGCQSLTDINIPRYVDTLGSGVFAACPNLSTVSIDDKNRSFVCLDGVIYSSDGKKLYQYLAGRPYSTYDIPQPVEEIGEFGFYGANMLTTVGVAQGVEEIPEYAFLNCTALNKVSLPNSVKAIRGGAFGGCTNLNSLAVPTTCGYIDPNAFTSLDGIKGDVVNSTTGEVLSESSDSALTPTGKATDPGFNVSSNDNSEQNNNSSDSGNTVSESNSQQDTSDGTVVSNIDSNSGEELASTVIVGGEAVFLLDPKSMHVRGFDLDAAQTEDSIAGSGHTSAVGEDFRSYSGNEYDVVGNNLGHYAGNAEQVNIPDGTGKIGNRVFYNNKIIKTATIPGSVNEIGDFAFARSNIESIAIPESVNKIGYAAFYNCRNLTDISVPSTVQSIELGAFDGTGFINNWRSIEDGNNFLVLGDGILVAYKGYRSDVVIPDSVKQIGAGVFEGNTRIKSITIPDSVTKIGEDAFNGCVKISSVDLPNGLITIEDRAFKNTNLNYIEIPGNVKEIGLGAFDTTEVNGGLESVIFKGTDLPSNSYKPTAMRLSASDLRTNSFNGTKYAFVSPVAKVNSSTIFDPHYNGFRGEVYSSSDEQVDGISTLQLRRCTMEPDEAGNVFVDAALTIGNQQYALAGVSDTAFNDYDNADWCINDVTRIALDGNNSDALNKLLANINYGANNDNVSNDSIININDHGISRGNNRVSAVIPNNSEKFNLNIAKDDSLKSVFNSAFDNRYGNHDGVLLDTYSIDMTNRLGNIPIKKMATNKLEISMPLPQSFNEYENVKVVAIDDNGLLEEVPCYVTPLSEDDKSITFVASHLSPYAIVVMGESEELTIVTDSVSIAESLSLATVNTIDTSTNIVYGTLTKNVGGIPARYIIAVILFATSALVLLSNKKRIFRK